MENTSHIKAIIFDWDGVILDSMPTIAHGIQRTAKSFGVDISVEQILSTYFQPKETFYASIGVNTENLNELRKRHGESDYKDLWDPKIFPDAIPGLTQLKEKGLTLAIATQRNDSYMQTAIDTYDVREFFKPENIIGGQEIKELKLASLVERLGLSLDEVLFVGDLPSDITSAKKAGTQSAGICRNESGKARLQAENPDYMLNSLEEISSLVIA